MRSPSPPVGPRRPRPRSRGGPARRTRPLLGLVAAGGLATAPDVHGADLTIVPADPDSISIHWISDTQFPWMCHDTPCSTIFATCVERMNARGAPDLTFHCGDLGVSSEPGEHNDRFLEIWGRIAGEKHFGLGNHEADPDSALTSWVNPADHWQPAVAMEPLFGFGGPDYRRWYSIHLGSPPRVALLALNNNSDSYEDDQTWYRYCRVPNDSLNHAGSSQREWLEAEIDGLPSTVQLVIVALHRTYYGVEDYHLRRNVVMSGTPGGWFDAPAETLRTGAVSFLRTLESIPDRTNASRVLVISGDQHCFSATHPIRENARDDGRGIPYLVIGGGGARIQRSSVFPKLTEVPPGTLRHAFDDEHFWAEMDVAPDAVRLRVHEAFADTLLWEATWSLDDGSPSTDAPAFADVSRPARGLAMTCRPNPAVPGSSGIGIELVASADLRDVDVQRWEVLDTAGRRVRSLTRGGWADGTWRRTWDLLDDGGRRVPSGVYLVRAEAGGEVTAVKVTVVR